MGPLIRSFANLLYPPLCLHCHQSRRSNEPIFCRDCLELMKLIEPLERCPLCFSMQYDAERSNCRDCRQRPPILDRIASAFDYVGPPASLVRALKYGGQTYLADGAASYMCLQFLQLKWSMPDVIVPVPMSRLRLLERGYNQSRLLGKKISAILNVPLIDLLKKKSGGFSQAGLNRKQRMKFEGHEIGLKSNIDIYQKSILLIDDVMTTGSTLQHCAATMLPNEPAEIRALVFCRATR